MSNEHEAIRRYFGNDRFATASGVQLIDVGDGFAKAILKIEPRHMNSVGIVQGGAIFTLADLAFAGACNAAGRTALAVNTSLSFLKATQAGVLHAEAVEVSRSRRISTCTVRVTNEAGELVALFQGTAYIKNEPFPPALSSET